jgi:glycolate oxidase iron-sulfur subunit
MQTRFAPERLAADADLREADHILRACVHCGFCTATCPTYLLLGDELDGPRGRIYLIKDMLEEARAPSPEVVRHIDRCLSCLGCMTTCPSGVHYQHLVDHARAYIETNFRRPLAERLMRAALAATLPYPARFRAALALGRIAAPFARALPTTLRHVLALLPKRQAGGADPAARPRVFPAEGERKRRVALAPGCVQQTLAPEINAATIRLLTRHGCEVVVAAGSACCGALTHHLGRSEPALASARVNIEAWTREIDGAGLDAIVVNASGCGTQVKDYGFMLREDAAWKDRAAKVSALARDVTELMAEIGLRAPGAVPRLKVAYHSACSLQHGQKVTEQPRALLRRAGFEVREVPEGHICCGSAGSYNILQPEIAEDLRRRKVANIERIAPDAIAAGNVGCTVQIAGGTRIPVVHTVELLDWATGGPVPPALAGRAREAAP